MNLKPTIMLSTTDLARLEHLLSQLPPHSPEVELLEQELERAIVVKPAEMPPDRVTMNSRVQFSVGNPSQSQTLTLMYPKDLDSSGEKISILAPVGSAMLGLAQGDEIAWPTPANPVQKMYQAGNFNKNRMLENYELTNTKIIDKKNCYKIKHFSNKNSVSAIGEELQYNRSCTASNKHFCYPAKLFCQL